MAPPVGRVTVLMGGLFTWIETRERHPLVASSIFHYELEFIPPFADGNGRMGRLWQALILSQWNPVFATAPVESMVRAHQQEYYAALNRSTKKGDSAPFVEFVLDVIRETLGHMESDQVTDRVSDQVKRLLRILGQEFAAVPEMMAGLALSHRPTFRKNYLSPALRQGLVEMKFPENPKHPGQRYRLTLKGRGIRAMPEGRKS